MVKKTIDGFDVEDLHFRLKCAVGCVDAIHAAMAEAPFPPETFHDALQGAVTYLYQLTDEMEQLYTAKNDTQERI